MAIGCFSGTIRIPRAPRVSLRNFSAGRNERDSQASCNGLCSLTTTIRRSTLGERKSGDINLLCDCSDRSNPWVRKELYSLDSLGFFPSFLRCPATDHKPRASGVNRNGTVGRVKLYP